MIFSSHIDFFFRLIVDKVTNLSWKIVNFAAVGDRFPKFFKELWFSINISADIETAIHKPIILDERIILLVLWNGNLEHIKQN